MGIDTLDTITLSENGGYLVIVSSVLRVKYYSVQGTGYRVIISRVLDEYSENTTVKG